MSKSEEVQDKTEKVQITVTRDTIAKLVEMQHEKFSKVELSEQGQMMTALAYCHGAKALLSGMSKEKAKEAMYKGVYDYYYMEGRKAAESLGDKPKDLKAMMEYKGKQMARAPFIPPGETIVDQETEKVLSGIKYCPFAIGLRKLAEFLPEWLDQDTLEVAICRCDALD
ncbi:MAG: hypothetical protein JRH15_20325, partial [Deltaproteobacteria bacterium]|nr:hypothetical protein [Deltaproteobacteria bacterium]